MHKISIQMSVHNTPVHKVYVLCKVKSNINQTRQDACPQGVCSQDACPQGVCPQDACPQGVHPLQGQIKHQSNKTSLKTLNVAFHQRQTYRSYFLILISITMFQPPSRHGYWNTEPPSNYDYWNIDTRLEPLSNHDYWKTVNGFKKPFYGCCEIWWTRLNVCL